MDVRLDEPLRSAQSHRIERVERHRFETSGIPRWMEYGLDVNARSEEYKLGSLYVEASAK